METNEERYWIPQHVREYLRRLGYRLPLEDMEPHIADWDHWMRAQGSFYDYRDVDGFGRVYEVHRRSIMPAMRVCREWGSLLLDEETVITCENQACTDFLEDYFRRTGFWGKAQETVVRAFGLGTGAFALRIDVGKKEVGIRHYDAREIIPLSWDSEGVREAAFVTRAYDKGKPIDQLQIHTTERGAIPIADGSTIVSPGIEAALPTPTYKILTVCFDAEGNEVTPAGVIPCFDTGSPVPTFALVKPAVPNTRVDMSPYGQSVFADAIDAIQAVDVAFDAMVSEVDVSKMRVFLADTVFDDIDAAIRAHDGAQTPYAPSEMAAAILALTWDTGLKARALLLDDGTLEFNYRSVRSSDAGTIAQCWEVDPTGYADYADRPWDGVTGQVKKVLFDSDWHIAGVQNYAYWCDGMGNLVEVRGFEELSGCTNVVQMFTSCASLETIYATTFDNTAITSSISVLYGCNRLVGGTGFVPTYSSGASALSLGSSGALTDPANNGRTWVWAHLYSDGDLEITTVEAPNAQRVPLESGRICANAHYRAVGCTPWYGRQSSMRLCRFCSDLAAVAITSLDYWFYANTGLLLVTGWDNVNGLQTMQHTFNGCSGITMLDMTTLDPSSLSNVGYAFASCGALQTIYVDQTWVLPSGCTGLGTFYGCSQIRGGNGTTYSASATGAAMMVVDAAGTAGYLTGA